MCVLFRKRYPLFLAFLSCAGFSFGIYTACISDPSIFSLMRMAASSHVSIVRVLLVVLLPFLISAIAVLLSNRLLLHLVVLIKSIFYGFCMYAICLEFDHAGWLMCMLLLLTDSVVLLSVHWFALRQRIVFKSAYRELSLLTLLCVGVGFFDATVISPFLTRLFNS
jgi:hypothetical protein